MKQELKKILSQYYTESQVNKIEKLFDRNFKLIDFTEVKKI